MKTATRDRIASAILEAYPMPERISWLKQWATWDLWHGPIHTEGWLGECYNPDPESITKDTWPGFGGACEELGAWFDTLPSTLYYDDDCDALMTREPEGYEDEEFGYIEPSPYWKLERDDIRGALFPRELDKYIS